MTDTDAPPNAILASLTPRQADVYRAIVAHFAAHQRMPTIREIGRAVGVASTNGVVCHLVPLAKKGLIFYEQATSRSVHLAGVTLVPQFHDSEAGRAARALWEEATA